ncbi:MAG: carbamoyl phosphate synthase small subunit, partial [Methanobacteriota archaeon]
MKAVLGLEDGTHVVGEGFGVEGCATGELVFTTQMTGYMEALTDPSYHGQILMFTYPLIGNYGVDVQNAQSSRVWAAGCVVRELCASPARKPLFARYFEEQGLSGIAGVDTRALTIRLRECGTMRSCLLVGSSDAEEAIQRARQLPPITGIDLIPGVTTRAPYRIPGPGKRIAVIDLGIKRNMITSLQDRGADLTVFPADATDRDVLASEPQALFISNGPGDTKRATAAIECVRSCIGELPIFGICMG